MMLKGYGKTYENVTQKSANKPQSYHRAVNHYGPISNP